MEGDSSKVNDFRDAAVATHPQRPIEVKSTDRDTRALARHGKRQQLNRTFGFISTVAFSSILLTSWEAVAVTVSDVFENGGPVSLVYGFFLSWTGTLMLCLSIAEMASMAPVSSAQYYFVAMLTNSFNSKLLSWIAGWVTVFAWQANIAGPGSLIATNIQDLIALNYESYVYERWHGTMIFWAIVVSSTCVNIFGIKILPHLETLVGILHICLWFVWVIPLVYLSPHNPTTFVFTDFESNSGWNSNGVSWCLGLLTVTFSFTGFEGACHISEEVQNAPVIVPRSMILSMIINGVLAFGFIIGLLFSVNNIESALHSPTNSPIVAILNDAFQSTTATTTVISLFIVLGIGGEMGMIASTSRLTFAFARDKGLPFSEVFAHVNPRYQIPINAVLLNAFIAVLLNLINVASSTAFNAVISLTTLALYVSYMLPIGIMISRRLSKADKPRLGPFNLGRFGLLVNMLAMLWGIFSVVFVSFPTKMPATADNMNYSSLVFSAAVVFSIFTWFVYGRRVYEGSLDELGEGSIPLT